MKILIVSQYFWPENFRINDLALELFKRGHEVTVLTGVPNYPDGKIYQNYKVNKKKCRMQVHGCVHLDRQRGPWASQQPWFGRAALIP